MQEALDSNHPCVSNSGSPPNLILSEAHFHIEIRLHSQCWGGEGREAMTPSPTHCSKKKKGNCISLIEDLLRRTKASTHHFTAVICPPKKCPKKGKPRHSEAIGHASIPILT